MGLKSRRDELNREDAFTLIELMVVCLLMSLVVTAIGNMITHGVETQSTSFAQIKIEEAGSEALDTITRQARGAAAISSSSTANLLIFACDIDGQSTPGNAHLEEVRYGIVDGKLKKGVAPLGTQVTMTDWIDDCDQMSLTYWRTNDISRQLQKISPGPGDWDNGGYLEITRIDIQLNMSRSTVNSETGIQRTMTASVDIRNTLQHLL
jgi:type II secretory pathway pseudopilin PulG